MKLDKYLISLNQRNCCAIACPLYSTYTRIFIEAKIFNLSIIIYVYDHFHDCICILYVKSHNLCRLSIKIFRFAYIFPQRASKDQRRTNFHTEFFVTKGFKATQVIELGKKIKAIRTCAHRNFPTLYTEHVREFSDLFTTFSVTGARIKAFTELSEARGFSNRAASSLTSSCFDPRGSIVPSPRAKKHRSH